MNHLPLSKQVHHRFWGLFIDTAEEPPVKSFHSWGSSGWSFESIIDSSESTRCRRNSYNELTISRWTQWKKCWWRSIGYFSRTAPSKSRNERKSWSCSFTGIFSAFPSPDKSSEKAVWFLGSIDPSCWSSLISLLWTNSWRASIDSCCYWRPKWDYQ